MRIEDDIHFSPSYRFSDLEWDDQETLINAFEERIYFYYLELAKSLNKQFQAFSRGLICLSLIDLFSKIETNSKKVGYRYEFWLLNHINELNIRNPDNLEQSVPRRFYLEFRNSLVHECLIDKGGQFSYDYNSIVHFIKQSNSHIMIINPMLLLSSIINYSQLFFENLRVDEAQFNNLRNWMFSGFKQDFKNSNKNKNRGK